MNTVSSIDSVENMEQLEKLENINPGVIRRYLDALPEKALNLGVRVLFTLVLIVIGFALIRLLRKIVKKAMQNAKADQGAIQFVDSCLKVALYTILLFFVASRFGLDATSVIAVVGSLGLTLGLALQGSLANFAGGVLILTMKPFKVGDYIIEDTHKNEGYVTKIQIFYTTLHTMDNSVVTIPNGTLANTSLMNKTASKDRRLDLEFGIAYTADLLKAKEIILSILEKDEGVNTNTVPEVFVASLGESAVNLGIHAWVKKELYLNVKYRIIEKVKLAFDENGIEIPYKKLDIMIKENPS